MKVLALICALTSLAEPALGQVIPQPGSGDSRLQSVEYRPDQVVQIVASPGYQVTIELAADEQVLTVAVGDSTAWQISTNKRANRLFVKPLQSGVPTNMTVETSARNYTFDLVSGSGSGSAAYTVRFRYPAEPQLGEPAGTVVGRYRLGGDHDLQPSAISDDGIRTIIEWPENVALPAVYLLDDSGRESLANGNMRGGQYVIDSVQRRLVFRLDRRRASARRSLERAE